MRDWAHSRRLGTPADEAGYVVLRQPQDSIETQLRQVICPRGTSWEPFGPRVGEACRAGKGGKQGFSEPDACPVTVISWSCTSWFGQGTAGPPALIRSSRLGRGSPTAAAWFPGCGERPGAARSGQAGRGSPRNGRRLESRRNGRGRPRLAEPASRSAA